MSYSAKLHVQNLVTTVSTAQVTLCSFDITALPGVGQALVVPYVILAEIKVLFTGNPTPDHASRVWRKVVVWERSTGVLQILTGTPYEDDNSGGVIGSSTQAAPTYDISGNLGRVRVIPMANSSIKWFTRMDLTVLQG